MTPLDADIVRRRFVWLTALRWLPTGFLIPATVVLMQSRGLSLAQVGLASAVQSTVVLALELPTGGLADAIGRRRVLLLASLFDIATLTLILNAHTAAAFMVAWAIQGVYRALESGPLEAWYVDAALEADPRARIEDGLARATTALGLAISLGALGTAAIVAWHPIDSIDAIVLPVVVALVLRVVNVVGLAVFVQEPHREQGMTAIRAGLHEVPTVIRSGLHLITASRALRALVLVELLWGAGMIAPEMLSAPRLVELLGDADQGVTVMAVAASLGWAVSAGGSALTPWVTRRLGGQVRAAMVLRVVQGAAVALIGLVAGPAGLITGYLGFYLVHGTANVLHYSMVHRLVDAGHRTLAVSANSLTARIGSVIGGITLGAVATSSGIPAACCVAAVVLAAAAPLYRRVEIDEPSAGVPPQTEPPVEPNAQWLDGQSLYVGTPTESGLSDR